MNDILPKSVFVCYEEEENRLEGILNGEKVFYTEAQHKAFMDSCRGRTKHIILRWQTENNPLIEDPLKASV